MDSCSCVSPRVFFKKISHIFDVFTDSDTFFTSPRYLAVTCSVSASPEANRMQRRAWYVEHVVRQSSELVCCRRSTGNLDSRGHDSFPTAPCIRQPLVRWLGALRLKSTGLRILWEITSGNFPHTAFFLVRQRVHLHHAVSMSSRSSPWFLAVTCSVPNSSEIWRIGTCFRFQRHAWFSGVHALRQSKELHVSRPPNPHACPSFQSCDFIAFAGVFNAPELLSQSLHPLVRCWPRPRSW